GLAPDLLRPGGPARLGEPARPPVRRPGHSVHGPGGPLGQGRPGRGAGRGPGAGRGQTARQGARPASAGGTEPAGWQGASELPCDGSVPAGRPRHLLRAGPAQIQFRGTIRASGPGAVRYTFVRSDGARVPVKILTFDKAGVREVWTNWSLPGKFEGWQ